MSQKELSICIPTYNFGEFIGATLKQVLTQSDPDRVETIVVDGASTDNTREIVAEYQRNYPQLRYRCLERKGGIDKDLEETIAEATGRYCWLLSSDDYPVTGGIARILREVQSGHSIYLFNRIDCDREMNEMYRSPWLMSVIRNSVYDFSDPEQLTEYLEKSRHLGALFSYISSIVVDRSLWQATKQDPSVMGSNYAHVLRLFRMAMAGNRVQYIADPLVKARNFNDSFRKDGLARRFLIDLDGYSLIAGHLFPEGEMKQRFNAVMRREHKWYYLAGLRNKVEDPSQWAELRAKFSDFGFPFWQMAVVEHVGGSPKLMALLRRIAGTLR
ncbi:MAG: glycosyltransferase family 2 protein [Magnetococcus sp. WYHC-3]